MRSFNSRQEFYDWQTKQEAEGALAMFEMFIYSAKLYVALSIFVISFVFLNTLALIGLVGFMIEFNCRIIKGEMILPRTFTEAVQFSKMACIEGYKGIMYAFEDIYKIKYDWVYLLARILPLPMFVLAPFISIGMTFCCCVSAAFAKLIKCLCITAWRRLKPADSNSVAVEMEGRNGK